LGDDSPLEWCCDTRGTAEKAKHRRDEYSYGRLASLVGVRRTLLILALSLLIILLGWSTPLSRGQTPWRDEAVSLVGVIGAPILGGLIASRRARNTYGWLWLGFGLGLSLQLLGESYAAYALVAEPASLVAPQVISRLLSVGGPVALTFAPFLLLLFPTGRLPSPKWRPLAWVAATSGAILVFLDLLYGSPDRVGGSVTTIAIVVVSLIFAAVVLSALSLVARYHRASGVERQQLKWFTLAAVLAASYLIGQSASFFIGQLLSLDRALDNTLWTLLDVATNTGLYVAVGVAILRYRLYDIDLIINRTLVYLSLTATLVALYFGGIVLSQRVFVFLTGEKSTLAVVASTLVIAALFAPLRRRIQSFIDRRFYRRKYDASKTLEAFSAKLRDETDLDRLGEHLEGAVGEAMQPAHASLWLRPAAGAQGKHRG
jgi:hypothetical protein